ncbi:MAG TPA: hypothetical protein VF759_06035 [Allosphingosinicella sp.]|jgi:hypothetical protein
MLKPIAATIIAAGLAATAPLAAQGSNAGKSSDAAGQDKVCLVTWRSAADAATGADATAINGKYLPRKAAEQQAANSGGKSRVFDYSNSTQAVNTGTYTIANNEQSEPSAKGRNSIRT